MAFDVNITFTASCTDSDGTQIFSESYVSTVQLDNFIRATIPLAASAPGTSAVSLLGDLSSKDMIILIPALDVVIALAGGVGVGTDIEVPAGTPFLVDTHTTEIADLYINNPAAQATTVRVIAGDKV